jgi:L-fuconolactonase
VELARKFPAQRFVLDHIAKPDIKGRAMSPWREEIQELAKSPNVMCKVSGMVTEAVHTAWQPADIAPYMDVVFAAFGEDRVMYGSDWPVCLLAGGYDRVHALAADYARRLSEPARAKFLGGNAERFYLAKRHPA